MKRYIPPSLFSGNPESFPDRDDIHILRKESLLLFTLEDKVGIDFHGEVLDKNSVLALFESYKEHYDWYKAIFDHLALHNFLIRCTVTDKSTAEAIWSAVNASEEFREWIKPYLNYAFAQCFRNFTPEQGVGDFTTLRSLHHLYTQAGPEYFAEGLEPAEKRLEDILERYRDKYLYTETMQELTVALRDLPSDFNPDLHFIITEFNRSPQVVALYGTLIDKITNHAIGLKILHRSPVPIVDTILRLQRYRLSKDPRNPGRQKLVENLSAFVRAKPKEEPSTGRIIFLVIFIIITIVRVMTCANRTSHSRKTSNDRFVREAVAQRLALERQWALPDTFFFSHDITLHCDLGQSQRIAGEIHRPVSIDGKLRDVDMRFEVLRSSTSLLSVYILDNDKYYFRDSFSLKLPLLTPQKAIKTPEQKATIAFLHDYFGFQGTRISNGHKDDLIMHHDASLFFDKNDTIHADIEVTPEYKYIDVRMTTPRDTVYYKFDKATLNLYSIQTFKKQKTSPEYALIKVSTWQ